MIRWLIQSVADHPELLRGRPPQGLLTEAELDHYHGYRSMGRRRDWLLGRWTAKHLVARSVTRSIGFVPDLQAFHIAQDPSGAPYVQSDCPALATLCGSPSAWLRLSISHSQDYALAAVTVAAGGAARLGVDIEAVDQRQATRLHSLLSRDEQRTLERTAPPLRTLMTAAIGSAKEAAAKATNVRLHVEPGAVQCILRPEVSQVWQSFLVEMSGGNRPALRGWWRVLESTQRPGRQFVVALAAQAADL